MNVKKFNDYEGFVEKFKPKKTTDDCYTPPAVYQAVLDYVKKTYNLPDDTLVLRPFYPGGDYESVEYPEGCIVVDNPPFSIFAKIVDFYLKNGIKFFLFAPALTTLGTVAKRNGTTFVHTNIEITYENGAKVNTGFITNLSPEVFYTTAPALHQAIKAAQDKKAKNTRKIEYPENIFTVQKATIISRGGLVDFSIKRYQMATSDVKNAFGGCCLISDSAAKAAAKAAAKVDEYISLPLRDKETLERLNAAQDA